MDITLQKHNTESNRNIMRKLGYFENFDKRTGKISYIKRLSRQGFYPRFHVYIDETGQGRLINLHLDQKQPSYVGASAHNAEYDSEVVKKEGERIRGILECDVHKSDEPIKIEEKKGFWEKIFSKFKI